MPLPEEESTDSFRIGQECIPPEQLQHLPVAGSKAYLEPDNLRPFSLRHAVQQASIGGNLDCAGLLKVITLATTNYTQFSAENCSAWLNLGILCRMVQKQSLLSLARGRAT